MNVDKNSIFHSWDLSIIANMQIRDSRGKMVLDFLSTSVNYYPLLLV
jgi:hypothetical protein